SEEATAARIVALLLALHRRWRGFRASLRALVATDAAARRSHRRQRVRQLRLLRELRVRYGGPALAAEDDALLLFTLERVCDAAADGELRDLGLSRAAMVRRLEGLVPTQLGAQPDAARAPSGSSEWFSSFSWCRPSRARGSPWRRTGSASPSSPRASTTASSRSSWCWRSCSPGGASISATRSRSACAIRAGRGIWVAAS